MKKILNMILSLGLVFGMFYGLWFLLRNIWINVLGLNPALTATIITGSITFLGAFTSVILGKYYERKLVIEKELREKKIPIYNEFISFFIELLVKKNKFSEEEMLEFLTKFTKELIIWGSDDVIKKWSIFRIRLIRNEESSVEQTKEEQQKLIYEFEELLMAIRKDTGSKNTKLKKGDVLNMFINDL